MAEIVLRAIEKEDLALLQRWRNSEEVMPYCRQYRPLSVANMQAWYRLLNSDKQYNLINDLFMIIVDGVAIGVGGFVRIDWRNRKAELSFYVGENPSMYKNNLSEILVSFMDYGSKTLGLHKIYWPVYSFNPYLKIYEKLFKKEAVLKKEYYWNGKFHDRIIFTKYFNNG